MKICPICTPSRKTRGFVKVLGDCTHVRDQVSISESAVQHSQTISLEPLTLETMASQPPSTKQDIIASLFSKRAAEDGNLEESYISHVKIFEDDGEGGGVKARYLTLSGASLSAFFSSLGPPALSICTAAELLERLMDVPSFLG